MKVITVFKDESIAAVITCPDDKADAVVAKWEADEAVTDIDVVDGELDVAEEDSDD